MEQYYRLFKSYRVPGLQKDSLILNSTKLVQEPEHVIVICRNQVSIQSKWKKQIENKKKMLSLYLSKMFLDLIEFVSMKFPFEHLLQYSFLNKLNGLL